MLPETLHTGVKLSTNRAHVGIILKYRDYTLTCRTLLQTSTMLGETLHTAHNIRSANSLHWGTACSRQGTAESCPSVIYSLVKGLVLDLYRSIIPQNCRYRHTLPAFQYRNNINQTDKKVNKMVFLLIKRIFIV